MTKHTQTQLRLKLVSDPVLADDDRASTDRVETFTDTQRTSPGASGGTLRETGNGSQTQTSDRERALGGAPVDDAGGRIEWIKSECRYFLIDAMWKRDDRLALFAHRVLAYMIEEGEH